MQSPKEVVRVNGWRQVTKSNQAVADSSTALMDTLDICVPTLTEQLALQVTLLCFPISSLLNTTDPL